uniref:Secreted protein n=1 Tax=Calcidiscus leptoporus TaxID=127549 RepID=A0A7S0NXY4_9EUKA|mmetsp:Transcript_39599/g.92556  ORF Transcript_39599/g.92556 Transcript_39599/m.92556 type:complete len:169 (+) Transcript_39599:121-627(+)
MQVLLLLLRLDHPSATTSWWAVAAPWVCALLLECVAGCIGCASLSTSSSPPDGCADPASWLMQYERTVCCSSCTSCLLSALQLCLLLSVCSRLSSTSADGYSLRGSWGEAYTPYELLLLTPLCCCTLCAMCVPRPQSPSPPSHSASETSDKASRSALLGANHVRSDLP